MIVLAINFECKILEKEIRRARGFTGSKSGPIYPEDVLKIKNLPVKNFGITSLEGIQHLVNLQAIDLGCNSVSDLTPLQNLVNLQRLWFEGNQVSDLTPLQNLVNLRELYFDNNQVSDLTPLQNLVNLQILYFNVNQVSDLTPLQNLVNLQQLGFNVNQVSDLTPLRNLINLQRLSFNGNQVSDLTPLRNLVNLQQLWLDGNQISDLTPLRNLVNLLIHGFQNMNDINTLVGRGVMVMESGNGAEKDYLSISELSKKTELPTATIRRWVTTYKDIFGRFIKPIGEFIYYEPNIVEWLKKVQELYDAGMKESLIDEWYTFVTEENDLSNSLSISELSKVTGIPAVTIRQWVSFTHDRVFDEYVMTDIGGFLLFDPGIVKQLEAARDIYRDCPENGENYVNFIFKHNCSLLDRDFG